MNDQTTDPGHQSAREVEREVDQRREDLTATVEALGDRFSAERIIDSVVQSVSRNGGDVSRNLGRTMRDNPVPVLLTGVGLAWLMASSNKPSGRDDDFDDFPRRRVGGMTDPADHEPTRTAQPASGDETFGESHAAGTDRTYARSSTTYEGATDRGSLGFEDDTPSMTDRFRDGAGRFGESATDMGDRVGSGMARAGSSLGSAGSGASDRAEAFLNDQPLIVAALAFASGLGIGGMLPGTRTEDDMMGATSDRVRDDLQHTVADQVDRAEAVAGAVMDEASAMVDEAAGEADDRTPHGDEMVDTVKQKAKEAGERLRKAGEDADPKS